MKNKVLMALVWAGLLTAAAGRAADSLTEFLQKGLVEEEVNHDLEAAARYYKTVVTLQDAQRTTAATAVFRLGEVLRKQGKTNEANIQYQRVLNEFPDQAQLAKLSRQYLGDGAQDGNPASSGKFPPNFFPTPGQEQERATAQAEWELLEARLEELKKMPRNSMRKILPNVVNDARLSDLLIKLGDAEQRYAALSINNGEKNPDVVRVVDVIKIINHQIDETIDGIFLGMETQARIAKTRLEAVKKRLDEANAANRAGSGKSAPDPRKQDLLEVKVPPPPSKEELEQKELAQIKAVLDQSPDLVNEIMPSSFLTRLHLAVEDDKPKIVQYLVSRGADVSSPTKRSSTTKSVPLTPLALAAAETNLAMMDVLLTNGADINFEVIETSSTGGVSPARSGNTYTVLSLSAKNSRLPVVEFLLKHGANVDAPADATPLWRAVNAGNKAIVEALIAHGAAVNVLTGTNQETALHAAVASGFKNLVEILLSAGADANATNKYGLTPLFVALHRDLPMMNLLVAKGANLQATWPWLLSEGRVVSGNTLLHAAALDGREDMVLYLLTNGVPVNATNSVGQTALERATTNWRTNVMEVLLAHGANPNWPAMGFDVTLKQPLLEAVEHKDERMIRFLLEHGADVNVRDPEGGTPLLRAVNRGNESITSLLLENGANPNARYKNRATALHQAALTRNEGMARRLLEKGADPNLSDEDGTTPLHHAVATGTTSLVELLLAKGADVNARGGKKPATALTLACAQLNSELVRLLLGHQANVNVPDGEGSTPLDLARNGHQWRPLNQPPPEAESWPKIRAEIIGLLLERDAVDQSNPAEKRLILFGEKVPGRATTLKTNGLPDLVAVLDLAGAKGIPAPALVSVRGHAFLRSFPATHRASVAKIKSGAPPHPELLPGDEVEFIWEEIGEGAGNPASRSFRTSP
ncbi:MAG TPA: ankyrin repeat domain-containing protein [Verrucomicrobiae bacterium]|nr:ankyrin repeat domain-containing protein [Verrucomicrobiae bacterium]